MDRCAECGYVYDAVAVEDVPGRLRAVAADLAAACSDVAPALASTRPEPATWSPLEYACHIRDVLLVQRDRVVLAQVEERPSLARMHREERVAMCGYDRHPLADVLAQVEVAAELCATAYGLLAPGAWDRAVVYNWPEPAEHDLRWLARHTLHEGEHHLMDVRRGLDVLAAS
ncbi:MAG: DinB family protein [Marmoricola sp.]